MPLLHAFSQVLCCPVIHRGDSYQRHRYDSVSRLCEWESVRYVVKGDANGTHSTLFHELSTYNYADFFFSNALTLHLDPLYCDILTSMPLARLKAAVEEGFSYLLPEMSSRSTAVPVSPEDTVWLLDTTAFPASANDNGQGQTPSSVEHVTDATWTAEFVACFFAPDKLRTKAGKWIAQIAQELKLAPDDEAARRTIETRIQPFLAGIVPSKQLSVRINGRDQGAGDVLKLERSDRNGISSSRMTFNGPVAVGEPGAKLKCVAITEPGDTRDIEMDVFCASAGGWGIISGIILLV